MRLSLDMTHATANLERARTLKPQIEQIALRYGVSNIRVFGSVARGDPDVGSDLDLLVDIDPERSLLDLSGFLLDIRDLLGVDVDVVTDGDHLDPRLRARVLASAIVL